MKLNHDFTKGALVSGPKYPFAPHSGPVHSIIVHYTWSQWANMKKVWQWHKKRGFNGPGYHFLIRIDGTLEYGRPEWAQGAHCRDNNDRTLGICYEGGRIAGDDKNGHDTRTPAQKRTMAALIHDLKARHPEAKHVLGHRQVVSTQCPGFDARAWWNKTKSEPAPRGAPALTEPRKEGWLAGLLDLILAVFGKGTT